MIYILIYLIFMLLNLALCLTTWRDTRDGFISKRTHLYFVTFVIAAGPFVWIWVVIVELYDWIRTYMKGK